MGAERVPQVIVSVSPFKCRMWSLHDRLEEQITEKSCRAEIESIRRHGQLVPALGRKLKGDPMHDVELIYGARRLFVARHLNLPLRVELREITDRESIVAMDIENRQRQDISPYERGLSYARWLREGHFKSQDDIAAALRVSASRVSRLLKIARLPPVVMSAFDDVGQLCEAWALEIASALEDQEKRAQILRAAREIGQVTPRLPAREVCRRLLAARVVGRKPVARLSQEVICDEKGKPLFRVRHERRAIALLLPIDLVSAVTLKEVCGSVRELLQGSSAAKRRTPRAVTGDMAEVVSLQACAPALPLIRRGSNNRATRQWHAGDREQGG
jgi:ParB family transcriptional regulator, chromosome partitioning protein